MDEQDILIFQKRHSEFVDLLESSKSRTSQNLITEAINISEENINLYNNITFKLFEYLTELSEKKRKYIDKYNQQFILLETQIKQVSLCSDSKEHKDIMIAYYQSNLDLLNSMQSRDDNINRLMTSAFQFVAQELKVTLFDYIFKPNQFDFNIEIVVNVISLVLEKFIPLMGDAKNVLDIIKKIKKRSYLKEGDKLFQYLEKYIDASILWKELVLLFNENGFKD